MIAFLLLLVKTVGREIVLKRPVDFEGLHNRRKVKPALR